MLRASLESQLNNASCEAEDTEEMFWLRESDDYQSKVKLGNSLAAQYRFREAALAYEEAKKIKATEPSLMLCLGGAYLTLFKYDEAIEAYTAAQALGASAKSLAYPLGVLNYLKKDYKQAAEYFLQCLPSNGEMEIAVIYWHSLACYMAGTEATLLDTFSENMEVGHHIAYKKTVTFFKNNDATDKDINNSSADLYSPATNDLDKAIILYGLSVFYKHINNNAKSKEFLDLALECSSVWPCVSYLAAYRDKVDSHN